MQNHAPPASCVSKPKTASEKHASWKSVPRPFVCHCGKKYTRQDNLIRHQRNPLDLARSAPRQPLIYNNDNGGESKGKILYDIGLHEGPGYNTLREADVGMELENTWKPQAGGICFEQTSAFPPTPFNIEKAQCSFWSLLELNPSVDVGQPSPELGYGIDFGQFAVSTALGWYGNGILDNEPLAFTSPPPSPSSDAASVCFGQPSVYSKVLEDNTFPERYFLSTDEGLDATGALAVRKELLEQRGKETRRRFEEDHKRESWLREWDAMPESGQGTETGDEEDAPLWTEAEI
ncbi:hypothetical protein F5144DRAFT_548425 [Chaetomium tenue]|uniref:Uncharacterized protein n=1 Tax=Chaetomium tenue TaxID=1854479 RepID=A0ACB7P8A8_9PEZI|nr:hypothetical protein F5144DRAFT_548425 [Chaetomium globosum]